MKVIIVGAGEVGYHLAERLSQESQDVIVIDTDPERAERASELLDVMTVVGNGASIPILEKAGVASLIMWSSSRTMTGTGECSSIFMCLS